MSESSDFSQAYTAIVSIGGICTRADRAIIEIAGKDRAAWLSNLVTNVVKTLQEGEGNYAFAVNLKGRVVFDANIFALFDRILLDVDRRWIERAMAHLEKYVITEDVQLRSAADDDARLAIIGPMASDAVAALGCGNLPPMAQLQHVAVKIGGVAVRMLRHDFVGLMGAEFIVPRADAGPVEQAVRDAAGPRGMIEAPSDVLETLRIEAGLPASVTDIDDDVVPPETGQIERGISYHKGCYLGQEVIERMRSHGTLARRLVGIAIDAPKPVEKGAVVRSGDQDVGRVTSWCRSEAIGGLLALGYVKTAAAKPGQDVMILSSGGSFAARIVPLPVRGSTK